MFVCLFCFFFLFKGSMWIVSWKPSIIFPDVELAMLYNSTFAMTIETRDNNHCSVV